MGNPRPVFYPLFIILFSCSAWSKEDLMSCLTRNGVSNYTTSSSPDYETLLKLPIQNLRFTKPALSRAPLLIFPNDPHQMSLSFTCSRSSSATIRLRSGGHAYEGFSSLVNDETPFVIIDMMNLNRVEVDVGEGTAWLQGGATVGEVHHAVWRWSNVLAFPAGLCPTVGLGGHVSGGGYGALARRCGLAADNVVDATIIEPERGYILHRVDMGEDVFWAIRGGGGGNFGAVVAWKIKLCQVPDLVTAFKITRSGSPARVSKLWNEWQVNAPNLPDDLFVMILATSAPAGVALSFYGLFLGTRIPALDSMNSAFPELGVSMDELQEMTWIQSVVYLAISSPIKRVDDLKDRFLFDKTHSKIKSDFVRHPIPQSGIRGALELVETQPMAAMALSPYGGAMDRISSDAIGFPHRAGNLYSIEYLVSWEDEDYEEECIEWLRKMYGYMTPYVSKGPRAAYINDVDIDLGVIDWDSNRSLSGAVAVEAARVWGEKYFLGNYDRLVHAKTQIDPNNVLRHPQSVPPLMIRCASKAVLGDTSHPTCINWESSPPPQL